LATLNISLPDDMKAFIEAEAVRKGFRTTSEYMLAVIREAQGRAERRTQVDALLLEGLDSGPATPLTASDWSTIHQQLEERLSAREGEPDGPRKADRR